VYAHAVHTLCEADLHTHVVVLAECAAADTRWSSQTLEVWSVSVGDDPCKGVLSMIACTDPRLGEQSSEVSYAT
jgi:hypothetical protein